MGVTVDVGVAVGGTRVGVAVDEGVKLGVNVGIGVAVGGSGVGVFDGVGGNNNGVSLDVGSAVSTVDLGPGVAIFVVAKVGETISIAGKLVTFNAPHAVKANTITKPQRFNFVIKYLIPIILNHTFFSRIQI